MNTLRLSLCAGLALLLTGLAFTDDTAAAVAPSRWTLGTGLNYSKGDYGFATDTEVLYAPLNLGYEGSSWLLRASIPWISLKGPAANTGGGGVPRPTTDEESGLGDIYASATYRFGETLGPVYLDFTGRVKFPTADETVGLGTGETDYYGQFDFYRTLGRATPFVSVGYRFLGDSPAYQLEDGLLASAGSHFRVSPATVWTLAANWSEPYVVGGDESTDAMLSVTHDFNDRWQLSSYVLKGFTDASPDYGAGLQVTCRF